MHDLHDWLLSYIYCILMHKLLSSRLGQCPLHSYASLDWLLSLDAGSLTGEWRFFDCWLLDR